MNQNPVMEVVRLQIKPDNTTEFEAAMQEAIQYLQKPPATWIRPCTAASRRRIAICC
ncbi:MAG: hypothetical protein HC921_14615 [Synechococcaceae cyanobacterium SM2_3_1]|nr:hypothetical protein [Synechococcaceae cyanobacterium SM2_3_1]